MHCEYIFHIKRIKGSTLDIRLLSREVKNETTSRYDSSLAPVAVFEKVMHVCCRGCYAEYHLSYNTNTLARYIQESFMLSTKGSCRCNSCISQRYGRD